MYISNMTMNMRHFRQLLHVFCSSNLFFLPQASNFPLFPPPGLYGPSLKVNFGWKCMFEVESSKKSKYKILSWIIHLPAQDFCLATKLRSEKAILHLTFQPTRWTWTPPKPPEIGYLSASGTWTGLTPTALISLTAFLIRGLTFRCFILFLGNSSSSDPLLVQVKVLGMSCSSLSWCIGRGW